MFCYQNVWGPKLFGAKRLLEDWNDPQPERSRKRVGPNRLWTDFCVTKCLGQNDFHVTKRLLAEIVWYRNVLLLSYNFKEKVYFLVNLASACERNCKIIVVSIFYHVCHVYLPKLLLLRLKYCTMGYFRVAKFSQFCLKNLGIIFCGF